MLKLDKEGHALVYYVNAVVHDIMNCVWPQLQITPGKVCAITNRSVSEVGYPSHRRPSLTLFEVAHLVISQEIVTRRVSEGPSQDRTGHTIDYDGRRCQIVNDPEAAKLWEREYEDGWKPVF